MFSHIKCSIFLSSILLIYNLNGFAPAHLLLKKGSMYVLIYIPDFSNTVFLGHFCLRDKKTGWEVFYNCSASQCLTVQNVCFSQTFTDNQLKIKSKVTRTLGKQAWQRPVAIPSLLTARRELSLESVVDSRSSYLPSSYGQETSYWFYYFPEQEVLSCQTEASSNLRGGDLTGSSGALRYFRVQGFGEKEHWTSKRTTGCFRCVQKLRYLSGGSRA